MCRQTTAQKKILKMSSQYSPSGASRARLAHSVPNCSLTEKRSRWKIDTGAAVSLISEQQQKSLLPETTIQPSTLKLKTYTGEQMSVLGELPVEVNYEDQTANLVLVVVAGDGPRLFGCSWLQYLRLDWKTIANVAPTHTSLEQLLEQHSPIFKDELGTITAKLALQDNVVPKFRRPRPVPFSITQKLKRSWKSWKKQAYWRKYRTANGLHRSCVPKKDGRIHICSDYKVTDLEVDQYPLPKPEDLFATLAGGKKFTTLDMSQAYNQLI